MQPNNKIPADQSLHMYLATPLRGVEKPAEMQVFFSLDFSGVIKAHSVTSMKPSLILRFRSKPPES